MTLLKLLVTLSVLVRTTVGLQYTANGVAIVGTTEALDVNVMAGKSRQDVISYEFASYIAVHFTSFNLPDGDSVVITSPNENITVSHTYTGQGRDQSGTFIASFIPGNSVTVTYKSVGTASVNQGYRITGFSRGYPTMQQESICGDGDQSIPAKCYAPGSNLSEKLPQAYRKAQAVARLLINGTYLCTGWLGGSEGHLFTNHHCFEEEEWALHTDVEFMAESSSCSDQCKLQLGCAGKFVATSTTLIADSEDIDYSVVQLPDCVNLSQFGYLQLRESGPVVNESIYVPQHPIGYAKRIVSTVDNGDDTTIRSVGEDGNCGLDQVGHDADTQSGSSGSPLIASSDNLVVAIHHCGGCTNTAIDVRTVLNDLSSKNITIKNLVPQTVGQNDEPLYARTPCTAQSLGNHTKPSNSTSKTPAPTTSSPKTSSPVATGTTTTSSTSTSTSSITALTSASVVMSTKTTKSPSSSTPVTTVTSSSTNSTTTVVNSTWTSTTSTSSGGDKSPASTPTVDNDTIVAKLKAAVIGLSSLPPVATTPKPTKPGLAVSTTAKPTTASPTPAATVTSTAKPITPSPTPTRATVTPAPTTKRPTIPASTPCSTVTASSEGGWGDVEQN
ncbi:hypothetical protein DVH05_011514 [Phytophthora capsici]|nr:hypothetical protein DVH05_011514 [Phytophthora capsici]